MKMKSRYRGYFPSKIREKTFREEKPKAEKVSP